MTDSPLPYRVPFKRRAAGKSDQKPSADPKTLNDEALMAALHKTALASDLFERSAAQGTCPYEVNGHVVLADAEGVVYWPGTRTLIVADLHLEKGSSFARRGQLLPPYDTMTTLKRLGSCIETWMPERVIALGDSFHDREASARLPLPAIDMLQKLIVGRDWIWITGNHDPEPPQGLGGSVLGELREQGLIFRHEPQAEDAVGEFAGHLHPKARIVRRSRHVRRSCFAANKSRMILPSFGAYTGGLNVLDKAFDNLFEARDFHALMRGDGQVYQIAGSDLR